MEDGLLDEIILLEKRIQAEVEAEEVRASAWRERELANLAAAETREKVAEEARFEQIMIRAQDSVRREAEALESAAQALCRRLEEIDDDDLRRALHRHLAILLPGGDHDHPHGEG